MSALQPPTDAPPPPPAARRLSPPQPTGWARWLPGLTLLRPFPPPAWRQDLAVLGPASALPAWIPAVVLPLSGGDARVLSRWPA